MKLWYLSLVLGMALSSMPSCSAEWRGRDSRSRRISIHAQRSPQKHHLAEAVMNRAVVILVRELYLQRRVELPFPTPLEINEMMVHLDNNQPMPENLLKKGVPHWLLDRYPNYRLPVHDQGVPPPRYTAEGPSTGFPPPYQAKTDQNNA